MKNIPLVQRYGNVRWGDWERGGFPKGMKLQVRGCVTSRATPSNYLYGSVEQQEELVLSIRILMKNMQ